MSNKRLIQTFLELVQIDSPSGEEENIIDYLFSKLRQLKQKPIKDDFGNLILKIDGKGKPLLLSTHVDTVEPGRSIKPVIVNNIIKSSGNTILGADNKVAAAVILETMHVLTEENIIHRPLEIIFTKSEEAGSLGAVNLNYNKIVSKEGYIFDNANPIGTIITASPFYSRLDIRIKGKAAHSSKPEEGINALTILNNSINKIKLGKVTKNTSINIGIIKGGYVRNTIPEEINLYGEIRSFSQKEMNRYSVFFIKKFEEEAVKMNGKIISSIILENKGYNYDLNNNFIEKTKRIMVSSKILPILKKSWGCSDGNIFYQKGINVLDLGNGSRNEHTINESISIYDLSKLSDLILSLVTVYN